MEKIIHNVETGEVESISLTDEELAAKQAQQTAEALRLEQIAAAKKSAEEKLNALGLSVDDLKALGL